MVTKFHFHQISVIKNNNFLIYTTMYSNTVKPRFTANPDLPRVKPFPRFFLQNIFFMIFEIFF